MKNKTIPVSPETDTLIYEDLRFRNDVAFAHHCDWQKERITTYHQSVSDEQVVKALAERNRVKEIVFEENKNNLLFSGMGSMYPARMDDDICNYRIATKFRNDEGNLFFVEMSTWGSTKLKVNFSIDTTMQVLIEGQTRPGIDYQWMYYNYKGLERRGWRKDDEGLGEYTFANALRIVNEYFGCSFDKMVMDYWNIHLDDKPVFCHSPGCKLSLI